MNPPLTPEQSQALQSLASRFTGIPVWFGNFTRHWWALVDDRLYEVTTPAEMRMLLDSLHPMQPATDQPDDHADSPPGAGPYAPSAISPPPRPAPSLPTRAHVAAATPEPARPWLGLTRRYGGLWSPLPA